MKRLYLSSNHGRVTSLSVLVLIMLCVFVGLGSWQMQRKAEKESILASQDSQSSQQSQSLPLELDNYSDWRYRPVNISGRYLSEQQLLLENQIRERVVGLNVFTPLLLQDGRAVLVDRGWLPAPEYGSSLESIAIIDSDQLVAGYVYTPFSDGLRLGSVDNDQSDWPRMIQYIDYQQLSEVLGLQLVPAVVRLSPEADDGYLREWSVVAFGPERHLGYAVQWFALALAMLVIFIILVRRKHD